MSDNNKKTSDPDIEKLEKVRDLLFGPQLRQSGERFETIEKRLSHETGTLRDDIHRRLDALQESMRKEVAAIHERMDSEQQRLAGLFSDLANAVGKGRKR